MVIMRTPRCIRSRQAATMCVLAALAAGCAATQRVKVNKETRGPSWAFLGENVCRSLTARDAPGRLSTTAIGGGESFVGLRYVDPNVQWTQYKKVLLEPVTFWAGDSCTVSPSDQHRLADYFSQAIQQQLAKKYALVRQPGPGVMT